MAYFLQMNGSGDYIKLPSMTLTRIVFDGKIRRRTDVNRIVWDFRTGIGFSYVQQTTAGVDNWGSGSVKVDNVSKTNSTAAIPHDTRCTIEHTLSSGMDDGNIFTNNSATNNTFISGDIYDIKIYNGSTLVAWYDMTLGNVQDQSGNGQHATLTGGTWVSDGGSGTPGSVSYATKQAINSTSSAAYATKQRFNLTSAALNATKQAIYQVSSTLFATKQAISAPGGVVGSVSYTTKQALYAIDNISMATKQKIYFVKSPGYRGGVPLTLQEILSLIQLKYPHAYQNTDIITMINDIQRRIFRTMYKPETAMVMDLIADNPFYPITFSPENIIDVVVNGREYPYQNIKYDAQSCFYYITDGNCISLSPVPAEDVENGLTVFYHMEPSLLVNVTDIPELDPAWHMMLVYHACRELAVMARDDMYNTFITEINELERQFYRSRQARPHKIQDVYGVGRG